MLPDRCAGEVSSDFRNCEIQTQLQEVQDFSINRGMLAAIAIKQRTLPRFACHSLLQLHFQQDTSKGLDPSHVAKDIRLLLFLLCKQPKI